MGESNYTTLKAVPGTNFDILSAFDNNDTIQLSQFISDEFFADGLLIVTGIKFLILPFGVWANAIIMRTFVRMGLDDSVTIAFFALAVCDFCSVLCGTLTIPISILSYFGSKQLLFLKFQPGLIELWLLGLGLASNSMATYVNTVLACQRCLCIVRPLQFRDMMSKTKSWLLVSAFLPYPIAMLSWGYSSVRFVSQINLYWNMTQIVPAFTSAVQPFYYGRIIQYFIFPCVCQVLTTGCVILMYNKLRASVKFRKIASEIYSQSETSRDAARNRTKDKSEDINVMGSKERTAIIQVVLISLVFVIVNLLKITYTIISIIMPEFQVHGTYENAYEVFGRLMYAIDYINASVNILIYYNYNSRFRKLCFKSSKA